METSLIAPIEGALTKGASHNEKLIDTESQEFQDVQTKEKEYLTGILTAFGPSSTPKDRFAAFEPATVVEDSTTLEELKPALSRALAGEVEYWKAFIKAAKFSPTGEAQLALHERGLGYLNGERSDSRSFVEAIDQMATLSTVYAEGQKDDRIDELYTRENSKNPIWAGRLVYGKFGVLWNVGGSQIYHYEEVFRSHAQRAKNLALSKVPQS